ncbi:NADH-ubiquinone oxidoreductase 51 kDa subunit [Histoplasma capsulatum H143]|uniref:NADH-ubiquinone oxidoreductase 51 kDa subunit n=1 Tax=Ajellomyces capsulatus (strain H143) TaxID=544712 RepID=C6HIT7_AJECH|nr:NADH-ubiquinone oxidoreductase 51 kDa subunit [Histoplasma capsulatum H143]
MISRAAAPSTHSFSHITPRTLHTASTVSSHAAREPRRQRQQQRGLATVQDAAASPPRTYGGLKDQDRIFQNLYGHHGADLKTAMKYGDWYRTKDIVLKGHDWVWTVPGV